VPNKKFRYSTSQLTISNLDIGEEVSHHDISQLLEAYDNEGDGLHQLMTPQRESTCFSDDNSYCGKAFVDINIQTDNKSYNTSIQKCKEICFEEEVNFHTNDELMDVATCLNLLLADSGQSLKNSHSSKAGEDMMIEDRENGVAGNVNHLLYNDRPHLPATTANDQMFDVTAVDKDHQMRSLEDNERSYTMSCINNQQNGDRSNFLCRFFLDHRCKFGDTCKFLHDESVFCPQEKKIFLGGLSRDCTQEVLTTLLEEKGLTILNKPKIKGSVNRFSPLVCLDSATEAKKLIELGQI